MGSDLKLLVCRELKSAKKSVYLSTYGLTDPDILGILEKSKANIIARADQRSTKKHPLVNRIKKSGLHHAKITLIDEKRALIGSANSTTTSCEMHDNFLIRIRSEPFCQKLKQIYFEKDARGRFDFEVEGQPIEVWLTPNKACEIRLIELIDSAQSKIQVAIFTLCNKRIIAALENARRRGTDVQIVVDRYTRQPQIEHQMSRGPQLFHYKWALIDEKTLICGSANWTHAAFAKNREIVLIFPKLNPKQIKFCKRLFKKMA